MVKSASNAADLIQMLPEHLHGLDAIPGFKHRKAQVYQHRLDHVAHHVPRLRPAAPCRFLPSPADVNRFVRLSGNFFSRYREKDPKDTALARFALHRDSPVVRPHNPENHGQAQAPAGELGGEKRVKDLLEILFRDAAARIRHFQAGIGRVHRLPVDGKSH